MAPELTASAISLLFLKIYLPVSQHGF